MKICSQFCLLVLFSYGTTNTAGSTTAEKLWRLYSISLTVSERTGNQIK